MPDQKGYDNVNDAAAAALMRINRLPHANEREYIGLIYEDPETGKFLFTDPQTRNREGKTRGKFRIPKGSLRGFIHNHPEGGNDRHRDRLSEDDVNMSRQLGVPSFIGVGNELFMFSGKTRGRMGLTEPVLAKIPVPELKSEMQKRQLLARALLGPEPRGLLSPSLPGPFAGLLGPPR